MESEIVVRGRSFFFSQQLFHPETKEKLIDENIIKFGVEHKSIKRYAYILHDKDVYIDDDIENWCKRTGKNVNDCPFVIGQQKPAHYHIALDCPSNIELETISRWFNTPSSFIDIPKGRDAFIDCVEYETHEKQPKKHLYDDKEVKANFNFRKLLDERVENKAKYGKYSPSIYERMLYGIRYDGLKLAEVQEMDKLVYAKNEQVLKRLRSEYLSNCSPPTRRMNYYVCGKGGVGKGTLCRSLARSLFPQFKYDDEIYFEIGAKNATFEGYDGQPVIIWNDFRAVELLNVLGGRGNVFDVFDTSPSRRKQNIKYGSITLLNSVNLVNSVQDYKEFLKGLSGEYTDVYGNVHHVEDYLQSGRRFPVIIPVFEDYFEMYLNNGWLENNSDFESYTNTMNISISLRKVAEFGAKNPRIVAKLDDLIFDKVKPEIDKLELTEEKIKDTFTDEEIKELIGMNDDFDKFGKGLQISIGDENPFL